MFHCTVSINRISANRNISANRIIKTHTVTYADHIALCVCIATRGASGVMVVVNVGSQLYSSTGIITDENDQQVKTQTISNEIPITQ